MSMQNYVTGNNIKYIIRDIKKIDIQKGQFLRLLENLSSNPIKNKQRAYEIFKEITSNPLHRIFVAVMKSKSKEIVVGATSLLVEPKFIYEGGRVGHIEDVVVRVGYEKKGIGAM